jgi:hypothetical protein
LRGRALVALALAALVSSGCDGCSSNDSGAAPSAVATTPSALPSPSARPARKARDAGPPSSFRLEETPVEALLGRGTLGALSPVREAARRPGTFEASWLIDGAAASSKVHVTFALTNSPHAFRRPLAYARLARALDVRAVPAMRLRRTASTELVALTKGHAELETTLQTKVLVLNDGTIDTLVRALSPEACGSPWEAPRGRPLDVVAAPEIATWARWAASKTPAPGEDTKLTRAYVEAVILDYLGANVLRRGVWLCEAQGTLALLDNDTAFAAAPDAEALAALRKRVDPIARFPRSLYEHLLAFDRAAAEAVLAGGEPEDALVSPRMLDEYGERRLTVLSLVKARLSAADEASVLSL